MNLRHLGPSLFAVFAVAGASLSCGGKAPRSVDRPPKSAEDRATLAQDKTFPIPNAHDLSQPALRKKMWKMALNVDGLNRALGASDLDPTRQKESVIEHLENIEEVAKDLRKSVGSTANPLINMYGITFWEDVLDAIEAADAVPPNYYYAGKLVGSCMLCHQKGHEDKLKPWIKEKPSYYFVK